MLSIPHIVVSRYMLEQCTVTQEEEKVRMHTYRTEEFKEDFEEIEELDKED